MEFLNPKNWKPPKGYSNGVAAEGTQVFVAGQIGSLLGLFSAFLPFASRPKAK